MSNSETAAKDLKLAGGQLCLGFINTVDEHASDHPQEYLTSYAEVVAWSKHTSAITEDEGQHLLTEAAQRQAEAAAALEAAITFREALYRIFLAVLTDKMPTNTDLAVFNAERAQALAHSEIAATADGFTWRWNRNEDDLGWLLWPVALSAADLLLSPDLKQIKECGGPGCGWLFLDTSKNHMRRWCTMEGCGNRAKARGHYQRKRQSAQMGNHS